MKTLLFLFALSLSTTVLSNESKPSTTPQLIILEWKTSKVLPNFQGEDLPTRDFGVTPQQLFPRVELQYQETKRYNLRAIDHNTFELISEAIDD